MSGDGLFESESHRIRLFGTTTACEAESIPSHQYVLAKVPPDGNCLFAALSVAQIFLKEKRIPDKNRIVSLGTTCRAAFLKRLIPSVKANLNWAGTDVPIGTALEASSGLSLAEYERTMVKPVAQNWQSWGGFFEASFLGRCWNRRIRIYQFDAESKSLTLVTECGCESEPKHMLQTLRSDNHAAKDAWVLEILSGEKPAVAAALQSRLQCRQTMLQSVNEGTRLDFGRAMMTACNRASVWPMTEKSCCRWQVPVAFPIWRSCNILQRHSRAFLRDIQWHKRINMRLWVNAGAIVILASFSIPKRAAPLVTIAGSATTRLSSMMERGPGKTDARRLRRGFGITSALPR
eukprot:s1340_g3.t1